MSSSLPNWSQEVIDRYSSGSAGCFVLHGNVNDRMLLDLKEPRLGTLGDYLSEVLVPRFDVVLSYDLGAGVRVERGREEFAKWSDGDYPLAPLSAMRFLNSYLIYVRNLQAIGAASPKVAVIIKGAHLVCPSLPNALNYDLHALASIWRAWASEVDLPAHDEAVFLLSESLNDLHPLVAKNPAVAEIEVPLPDTDQLS
ncbi:hypothetical protein N8489_03010, partial [Akkermansiaceae bacterium]|nr:hypothetical protein [Akkermansiaceae bacterium]